MLDEGDIVVILNALFWAEEEGRETGDTITEIVHKLYTTTI